MADDEKLTPGRPIEYSDAARSAHRNHINWAFPAHGGLVPVALVRVKLNPGECLLRRDGSCVLADHPSDHSDCQPEAS